MVPRSMDSILLEVWPFFLPWLAMAGLVALASIVVDALPPGEELNVGACAEGETVG